MSGRGGGDRPGLPDDRGRFGEFGGCYIPETLMAPLAELEQAPEGTRNDALNRVAFNPGQFVTAHALPEDWTRAQLEVRAAAIRRPAVDDRRTIDRAFNAPAPRDPPP